MTRAAKDRKIILLRHAFAGDGSGADHERELTVHGHVQAAAVGRWLHEHAIGIDEVLCSTAIRARQTAEGVWEGGCPEADVRFDKRIYNAAPEQLLNVLREADEDANVVMLVGHAPGVPALASVLADGEGSAAAHGALAQGWPAGAVGVLTYQGAWGDLDAGTATLTKFHRTGTDGTD